jgi:hypothetical protein
MPLDWDANKVTGIDSLTDAERQIMDVLIWKTMSVGIDEITDDNVEVFAARVAATEIVNGHSLAFVDDSSGRPRTRSINTDDVRRFVGLRTNAGVMSAKDFEKYLVDCIKQQVGGSFR